MKIIYAIDELNEQLKIPSLMLCGPTPRTPDVKSWRPEALQILEDIGFNGIVFVPEPQDGICKNDEYYYAQLEWEQKYLEQCNLIVFWVPRNLETLPAFTTNIEFGMYVKSGKMIYGRPDDAPKNRYLDHSYSKFTCKAPHNNLKNLLIASKNILDKNLIECATPKEAVIKLFCREVPGLIMPSNNLIDLVEKETTFDRKNIRYAINECIDDNIFDWNHGYYISLNKEKNIKEVLQNIINDLIEDIIE